MLMNLFSSFDPYCVILGLNFSFNWISSFIGLMFFPLMFWVYFSRISLMFIKFVSFMVYELKLIISGDKIGSNLIFFTLMNLLIFNNFMGLFPYIFTSTSHLVFSFLFSLMFWFSYMIYGWFNFTNYMFCHLLPLGTPVMLMPILVCIETISNLIRSGTLAIRLTANMISGHLLLTLIGNTGSNTSLLMLFVVICSQSLLMVLEISVSLIQSYVFTVLSTLYSSEVSPY